MSLSGQDQNVRGWGWSALFEEDICFTLRGEHEEEDNGRRGGQCDKRGLICEGSMQSPCVRQPKALNIGDAGCVIKSCVHYWTFLPTLPIFLEVYYAFIKVYKAFNKKFWASEFCNFFETVARLSFTFCLLWWETEITHIESGTCRQGWPRGLSSFKNLQKSWGGCRIAFLSVSELKGWSLPQWTSMGGAVCVLVVYMTLASYRLAWDYNFFQSVDIYWMLSICQAFFLVLEYEGKEDKILFLWKLSNRKVKFVIRMITFPNLSGHSSFILAVLA